MQRGHRRSIRRCTECSARCRVRKRMERTASSDHRRRGIAFVWAAIFLLVLIGVIGLSLDWGKVGLNIQQLQNAADAAALAGAQFVKFDHDAARGHAIAVAAQNYADNNDVSLRDNPTNDPSLDVVVGYWIRQMRVFTPFDPENPGPTNAVHVTAPRTSDVNDGRLPLIFGSAFGTSDVNALREATAWSRATTGAGLICLATNATGLRIQGNASIIVNNGDIQVDSPLWNAATATGNSFTVRADEMNVVGNVTPLDRWLEIANAYGYSLNTTPDVIPIGDPLAHVPAVDVSGVPIFPAVFINGNQSVTLQPGYYPDGIRVNNGTVTLQPGIYAIGGGRYGLRLNGGTITGTGVMFYLTRSQNGAYAQVDINGNVRVQVTAPTEGPYAGISFFQDRANTRDGVVSGTADMLQTDGTLYFPNCGRTPGGTGLEVGGNGLDLGVQLITWKLYVRGNSNVIINYDGRNYVRGYRSILVR
jgi:hypothetical protein